MAAGTSNTECCVQYTSYHYLKLINNSKCQYNQNYYLLKSQLSNILVLCFNKL